MFKYDNISTVIKPTSDIHKYNITNRRKTIGVILRPGNVLSNMLSFVVENTSNIESKNILEEHFYTQKKRYNKKSNILNLLYHNYALNNFKSDNLWNNYYKIYFESFNISYISYLNLTDNNLKTLTSKLFKSTLSESYRKLSCVPVDYYRRSHIWFYIFELKSCLFIKISNFYKLLLRRTIIILKVPRSIMHAMNRYRNRRVPNFYVNKLKLKKFLISKSTWLNHFLLKKNKNYLVLYKKSKILKRNTKKIKFRFLSLIKKNKFSYKTKLFNKKYKRDLQTYLTSPGTIEFFTYWAKSPKLVNELLNKISGIKYSKNNFERYSFRFADKRPKYKIFTNLILLSI